MTAAEKAYKPQYTRKEIIRSLRGYQERGERIFAIDLALDTEHWLGTDGATTPVDAVNLYRVKRDIGLWLKNDDERLPEPLIDDILDILQKTAPKPGAGT